MPDTTTGKGSCLCGAVKMTAQNIDKNFGACHCDMCRKWGGGPLMATTCGSDVSFEGEENISSYASSEWAERAFCNKCGSHLYYLLKGAKEFMVPAGLWDTDIAFVFDHQFFPESKPPYYRFENKTKEITGKELFALYAPPES